MQGKNEFVVDEIDGKTKNSLFESHDLLRNHRKHGNQERRDPATD